jgi:hypothetical protein
LALNVLLFKFPSHELMGSCSSALVLVAKSLFNFKLNSQTYSLVCSFRSFREKCVWNWVSERRRTLITNAGLRMNIPKLLNTGVFISSLRKLTRVEEVVSICLPEFLI